MWGMPSWSAEKVHGLFETLSPQTLTPKSWQLAYPRLQHLPMSAKGLDSVTPILMMGRGSR